MLQGHVDKINALFTPRRHVLGTKLQWSCMQQNTVGRVSSMASKFWQCPAWFGALHCTVLHCTAIEKQKSQDNPYTVAHQTQQVAGIYQHYQQNNEFSFLIQIRITKSSSVTVLVPVKLFFPIQQQNYGICLWLTRMLILLQLWIHSTSMEMKGHHILAKFYPHNMLLEKNCSRIQVVLHENNSISPHRGMCHSNMSWHHLIACEIAAAMLPQLHISATLPRNLPLCWATWSKLFEKKAGVTFVFSSFSSSLVTTAFLAILYLGDACNTQKTK